MATVNVLITLRREVLDAPGQAVQEGLRALGYPVEEVRVGKYLEIVLPAGGAGAVDEMCRRFLANPLIETWRVLPAGPAGVAGDGAGGDGPRTEALVTIAAGEDVP